MLGMIGDSVVGSVRFVVGGLVETIVGCFVDGRIVEGGLVERIVDGAAVDGTVEDEFVDGRTVGGSVTNESVVAGNSLWLVDALVCKPVVSVVAAGQCVVDCVVG